MEVLTSLIGLALAISESILELAGIGSVGHGGSFWQLFTEPTPLASLLPKPYHTNPIQTENLNYFIIKNNKLVLTFIVACFTENLFFRKFKNLKKVLLFYLVSNSLQRKGKYIQRQ